MLVFRDKTQNSGIQVIQRELHFQSNSNSLHTELEGCLKNVDDPRRQYLNAVEEKS